MKDWKAIAEKYEELVESLDRYYLSSKKPSLDELIESEQLKADIAELEQEPDGQVTEEELLIKETKWIKTLLPKHYLCEPRKNGVHCYSEKGIAENKGLDKHFDYILKAIQQKYGERFMEIFHQTCTDHRKFTVYIHPSESNQDKHSSKMSDEMIEKQSEIEIDPGIEADFANGNTPTALRRRIWSYGAKAVRDNKIK